MFGIQLMPWESARDEASRIRFTVFVEEQGVPAAMELDEYDAGCIHALVRSQDGNAIATGRLLPDGHIGRMAVVRAWRGKGVGGAMLEALVEAAARRGDREVALSAQTHAIEFYRRHAFVAEGPEYMDAGIAHRHMRRRL